MIEKILSVWYRHNDYICGFLISLNLLATIEQFNKENYAWGSVYLVICVGLHLSYLDTKKQDAIIIEYCPRIFRELRHLEDISDQEIEK